MSISKTATRRFLEDSSESGAVLVVVTLMFILLLLFAGLSIDIGMAYLVKGQLSKAVDGAALAAARSLNASSSPEKAEAVRIFRANFPNSYLGCSRVTNPETDSNFFSKSYDTDSGANIVTIKAQAVMPTTFMALAGFKELTVNCSGEARRRTVDLSLVIDTSASIGSKWNAVRDAVRTFINSFDAAHDRISVTLYSNSAHVSYAMPSGRGFDKSAAMAAIPETLVGGSTAMVEGLYRGWDELRSVPSGSQSGLRVIVLFTDGCSNSVPGYYTANNKKLTEAAGYRTYDFPKRSPDPDDMTHDDPTLEGLYPTDCSSKYPACDKIKDHGYSKKVANWKNTTVISEVPNLPATSSHAHYRSIGIPTSFALQSNTLTVNRMLQSSVRGLRNSSGGEYPADIWNTNNAARNLLEIIANAARSEYPSSGDNPIRIYTIGMGFLLKYYLGTIPEQPESILRRIANDKTSPDYNSAQVAGKYYYAESSTDVNPAFQALRSEIVRLSR